MTEPAEDRSVEIDGEIWRDGDYCLDRFGVPYKVRNCFSAGGENTVAFESPPGSGMLHWLHSSHFEVLRPLQRVDAMDIDAVMSIRRPWAFWMRRGIF